MAKGQSQSNRETKKPKKPKIPVAPASAFVVSPPKGGSQTSETKKK